ncbi:MAG: endonuclease/exonuclease/phosphatase family protein [Bacteroidales bacterium]|nr:endonuclease/exonuclease/phosphatase family protein [Bacteroidales bacterium]
MKKLLAILLLFACAIATNAQNDTVTVISFNIRYNNPDDGDNIWENRRDNAVIMVNMENPDFLCVQEAYYVQLSYLLNSLQKYSYIGLGRDDGKQGGEHMAILYRKDRFEVVEHGDFWLSETPDVCSRGWDAVCHRIVTWGYFLDKQTGKHVYCFNTHLDHVGEVARRESVKLITQRIKEIVKDKKAPVFLTGDFNSDINSEIFDPLKKVMKQARKDAPVTDNKGTFNGWGSAPNNIVIDHIFYKNAKPMVFKTLNENKYGRALISDHYPIKGVFVY